MFFKFYFTYIYKKYEICYIISMKIDNEEFMSIISPIITHPEFIKRKEYMHHENQSVYEHSINVSYIVFKMAKKRKHIDLKSSVIGALLHDFYYKPWQGNKDHKPLFKKHGFVHAKEALENSRIYFKEYLNPIVENCILRHMFPLNIHPPKYKEAWLVTLADKIDSLKIFKHPKSLPKYLGIKKKKD